MDNDASSLTKLVQNCTRKSTFLHGFLYKYIVTICQRLLLLIIKFSLVPLKGFKSSFLFYFVISRRKDTSEKKKTKRRKIYFVVRLDNTRRG